MNWDNGAVEETSEQLTASYVQQLKVALQLKQDECISLHKSNSNLNNQIALLQEQLKVVKEERDFEAARADLAISCQTSDADPSRIAHVVSKWLPEHLDVTVVCCVKAGDAWVLVEESQHGLRLSHGTLLDDVVKRCGVSSEGTINSITIPESVLCTLGWSHINNSMAIACHSRCMWMFVGGTAEEAAHIAMRSYSLLETATELMMFTVVNQLERSGEYSKLCKTETSLEVSRLLLSTRYSIDRPTKTSTSVSIEPAIAWRMLPATLEFAINDVECDILVFLDDERGDKLVLSAQRGCKTVSGYAGSLTEKAIESGTELLVCSDRENISRDQWIDCGCESSPAEAAYRRDVVIAVAPIWYGPESHHITCPFSGSCLMNVRSALVFRLPGRIFSEVEMDILLEVVRDNIPVLQRWMENHMCDIVDSFSACAARKSNGTTADNHSLTVSVNKSLDRTSMSGIRCLRSCLENFIDDGLQSAYRKTDDPDNYMLMRLLASCFSCDWAVMLASKNTVNSGNEVNICDLMLTNDKGYTNHYCLQGGEINTNPLSQTIKHLLSRRNGGSGSDKCVVLNSLFGSSRGPVSGTIQLLQSLLHASGEMHVGDLNDVLTCNRPIHVVCSSFWISQRASKSGECVVVVCGRKWFPLDESECTDSTHEIQLMLQLLEECREKDSVYNVAERVKEQIHTLECETRKKEELERCIADMRFQFDDSHKNECSNDIYSIGKVLLDALETTKSTVFGDGSIAMLCASEEITGNQWTLGLPLGSQSTEVVHWYRMDKLVSSAINWEVLSCGDTGGLEPRTYQTQHPLNHPDSPTALKFYQILPLYCETYANALIDVFVLVFLAEHTESSSDSCKLDSHAFLWLSLIRNYVVKNINALLLLRHDCDHSTTSIGSTDMPSAVRNGTSYATEIAVEFLSLQLSDHETWMGGTYSEDVGDSVSDEWKTGELVDDVNYLCSTTVWQRLFNRFFLPFRISLVVVGHLSNHIDSLKNQQNNDCFLIDILHQGFEVSHQLKLCIFHALNEPSNYQFVSSSGKLDIQINCGRSHFSELLYRYLISVGDLGDYVQQDNVLLCRYEANGMMYYLLATSPLGMIITPRDIAMLENMITCAMLPSRIIKAHKSLKRDLKSISSVVRCGAPRPSYILERSDSLTDYWGIFLPQAISCLENLMHTCCTSLSEMTFENQQCDGNDLCLLDGNCYLHDGKSLAQVHYLDHMSGLGRSASLPSFASNLPSEYRVEHSDDALCETGGVFVHILEQDLATGIFELPVDGTLVALNNDKGVYKHAMKEYNDGVYIIRIMLQSPSPSPSDFMNGLAAVLLRFKWSNGIKSVQKSRSVEADASFFPVHILPHMRLSASATRSVLTRDYYQRLEYDSIITSYRSSVKRFKELCIDCVRHCEGKYSFLADTAADSAAGLKYVHDTIDDDGDELIVKMVENFMSEFENNSKKIAERITTMNSIISEKSHEIDAKRSELDLLTSCMRGAEVDYLSLSHRQDELIKMIESCIKNSPQSIGVDFTTGETAEEENGDTKFFVLSRQLNIIVRLGNYHADLLNYIEGVMSDKGMLYIVADWICQHASERSGDQWEVFWNVGEECLFTGGDNEEFIPQRIVHKDGFIWAISSQQPYTTDVLGDINNIGNKCNTTLKTVSYWPILSRSCEHKPLVKAVVQQVHAMNSPSDIVVQRGLLKAVTAAVNYSDININQYEESVIATSSFFEQFRNVSPTGMPPSCNEKRNVNYAEVSNFAINVVSKLLRYRCYIGCFFAVVDCMQQKNYIGTVNRLSCDLTSAEGVENKVTEILISRTEFEENILCGSIGYSGTQALRNRRSVLHTLLNVDDFFEMRKIYRDIIPIDGNRGFIIVESDKGLKTSEISAVCTLTHVVSLSVEMASLRNDMIQTRIDLAQSQETIVLQEQELSNHEHDKGSAEMWKRSLYQCIDSITARCARDYDASDGTEPDERLQCFIRDGFERMKDSIEGSTGTVRMHASVLHISSDALDEVKLWLEQENSVTKRQSSEMISDSSALRRLTVTSDGRIRRDHPESASSRNSFSALEFRNVTATKIAAFAVLIQAIIETPRGVQNMSNVRAVVPIGEYPPAVGSWALVITQNLESTCDMSPIELEYEVAERSLYVTKCLRMWLMSMELERSFRTSKSFEAFTRLLSYQLSVSATLLSKLVNEAELRSIPSFAAALMMSLHESSFQHMLSSGNGYLQKSPMSSVSCMRDYVSDIRPQSCVSVRLHWMLMSDKHEQHWNTVDISPSFNFSADSVPIGSLLKEDKWQVIRSTIQSNILDDAWNCNDNCDQGTNKFIPIVCCAEYKLILEMHVREEAHLRNDSNRGYLVAINLWLEYIVSTLRGLLELNRLNNGLAKMRQEETHHVHRMNMLVKCLKELHVTNGHLIPVIKSVEKILVSHPPFNYVTIFCKDTHDDIVLYDGDSVATLESRNNDATYSSLEGDEMKGSLVGEKILTQFVTLSLDFQVYEIKGAVNIGSKEDIVSYDRVVLNVLVKAIGRRIYELYRGNRNKRVLAETLRDLEQHKAWLEERDKEIASLKSAQAELEEEVIGMEDINVRLRTLLRDEASALEEARKVKRESDKHFKRVIDECRSEFEKKERTLSKTLEALKRQCALLTRQLADSSKGRSISERDLQNALDQCDRAERKKHELIEALSTQRHEYDAKVKELESAITKYKSELAICERDRMLTEEKHRSAVMMAEERVKYAQEKATSMELEVAATRKSTHFLKHQVESTSRALKLNQDELERLKLRSSSVGRFDSIDTFNNSGTVTPTENLSRKSSKVSMK